VRETAVSLDIAAPPERVWEIVIDITLMPQWSTELLSVEWAEGSSGPGPGAVFLGRNRHAAVGEWTTRSEIVAFEPSRTFGWAVGDVQNPAATWTFELEPIPEGTRLSYRARIGPGRSGVTMLVGREPQRAQEIVANRLAQFRASMRMTLEGIRERAESA
jgi:uncharacterized protein YndB with AHSA1/START domain